MDLSIITPFVGEYPQVLFTIQSIAQSLLPCAIDFEIIAVNNFCEEVKKQADTALIKTYTSILNSIFEKPKEERPTGQDLLALLYQIRKNTPPTFEDPSGEAVKAAARINPWLTYLEFPDRLSHWEAKRKAIEISKGSVLFFADAHTIPSSSAIIDMFGTYVEKDYFSKGSMHLPVSYKILESHKLIYKLKIDNAFYGYSFSGFRESEFPYEVPCMSTCGMMVSRELYDLIGGWPSHMTMYGGGENFFNFTLSICGFKKWIYPGGTLFHHGEKRDYHYTYDGRLWNNLTAHYLFGGEKGLLALSNQSKGSPDVIKRMVRQIKEIHEEHRFKIKKLQVCEIEDWARRWNGEIIE